MEHDATLRVIESIYETATTRAGWDGLLNEIADLAHADNAWLVIAMPELGMNTVIAPRSDPEVISGYESHWWKKDVTVGPSFAAPVGRITSLGEIGRPRFLSSEFYNEFWRGSGQAADRIACNLVVGRNSRACIGLQPSRLSDEIETEMAASFAVLVPHLVRSVQIRCIMRKLELEREIARATPRTGVVLVDATMRILLADEDAESILDKNTQIHCGQGRFALRSVEDTARLRCLVASCKKAPAGRIKGGSMFCRCDEENAGLRIDVLPFTERNPIFGPEEVRYPCPAAVLILVDPERNRLELLELLRERLELTPAEAVIALELVPGDSRADVAKRVGVSLATARTHMMHIFAKAGVHSRSALISRMTQAGIDPSLLDS